MHLQKSSPVCICVDAETHETTQEKNGLQHDLEIDVVIYLQSMTYGNK